MRLEAVRQKTTTRKLGWGKGLVSYVAPDFDEPLEDLAEYMETAEEEKMPRKKSMRRQMSGYLLDTHTVLWAFEGDRDLSRRAGRLIEDPANDVVISIVAYWELQIKQTIGKLRVAAEYNDRLWEWFGTGRFTRLGLQRIALRPLSCASVAPPRSL